VLRNGSPSPPEPMPKCAGISAQVVRNQCPSAVGITAQVTSEPVPMSARNTQVPQCCIRPGFRSRLYRSFRIEGVNVIPISNPSGERKRVTVWPHGSFLPLTRMR